jgi:hypothetical protein
VAASSRDLAVRRHRAAAAQPGPFTIYVEREWNGDVSRIARYLPDGWFALADLGALADRFPAPRLLGWTVLRAQAGLELPFVLLAYLTVCRWFGAETFRRSS